MSPSHAVKKGAPANAVTHVAPDVKVLPPGMNWRGSASVPVFRDDTWDLYPAVAETTVKGRVRATFDDIPSPALKLAAKEFIYARLHHDVPRGSRGVNKAMSPTSLYIETWKVKAFLSFLHATNHHDLTTVTGADYAAYLEHVRASGERKPKMVSYMIDIIWRLHAYREHVTGASGLPVPWAGFTAAQTAGYNMSQTENTTPRVPEAVMAPLLSWALFYIDVAGPDIIATAAEYRTLMLAAVNRPPTGTPTSTRLTNWLEQRRTSGRGLPVASDADRRSVKYFDALDPASRLNYTLIMLMAGLPAGTFQKRASARAILSEAAGSMPLEVGGFDHRLAIDPSTGYAWHPGLAPQDIEPLERLLMAACYVVVAYLSGMRDGEVRALRRGALQTETTDTGRTRYWLDGVAFKNEGAEGRSASWVVVEPVARAIETLEAMHDSGYLFARTWSVRKDASPEGVVSESVNADINDFVTYINAMHSSERLGLAIPDHEGEPWHLTTRQFRRTVAWHIANRPFGAVALKIQYQHVDVTTSLGYAGSSASGFRAEIEMEHELGALEDLYTMYERRRLFGDISTGPGGAAIDAELDLIALAVEGVPIAAREDRVRAMLQDKSTTLHVGPLVDCFFRAETAVCQAHLPREERIAPVVARCVPNRCSNARVGPQHRPRWAEIAEEAEMLSRRDGLPFIQVEALMSQARKARELAQSPEES